MPSATVVKVSTMDNAMIAKAVPHPTRKSNRVIAAHAALERDAASLTAVLLPRASKKHGLDEDSTNLLDKHENDNVTISQHVRAGQTSDAKLTIQPRRSGRSATVKKSKLSDVPTFDGDPLEYILTPASAEDRREWKGWCEVESEPAFFNVMLRDFGVEGVKVQEVISLDEEMLAFLPEPVFGLIFLFQFQEDDPAKQEPSCPEHIWFANQTTSNACATIALLNIVMNIPDIHLGPTLEQLKDFSMSQTPALRGYTVGNHDYLRQIHNSFTRKMDMLNADLFLSNDANSKRSRRKTSGKKGKEADHDQAGFHFIAFVPIKGSVWKLDGLERQPSNLGEFDEDWMDLARPIIEERMQRYADDQIQFNLLALCRSPLLSIPEKIAMNIKTLEAIEHRLERLEPDWKKFTDDEDTGSLLRGPEVRFNVDQNHLDKASVSLSLSSKLEAPAITATDMLEMYRDLINVQRQLRATFIDEAAAIDHDNERAACRRHDYTPMIHIWIRMLADKGALEGLMENI